MHPFDILIKILQIRHLHKLGEKITFLVRLYSKFLFYLPTENKSRCSSAG